MEKGLTSAMKKISASIESGRKGIEADEDLVYNLNTVKSNFSDIEGVIKGQGPSLDQMKSFSKDVAS